MTAQLQTRQRNKMIQYLTEAIRGAGEALSATEALICKDVGLSFEEWRALTVIGRTTRTLSVSQLARSLNHSRQSTHRLVVEMASAGLIHLLRNSDDRRLLQMEITAAGKSLLGVADTRRTEWLITMTYDLTEPELYVLMNRMRAVRHRIVRARTYA
jgi:DNA-binding MarR family transcriptional regulator